MKLAGGIMNTHSRVADARMEILSAHAAMNGASKEMVCRIMESVTTQEALAELEKEKELFCAVMESLIKSAAFPVFKGRKEKIQADHDLRSME